MMTKRWLADCGVVREADVEQFTAAEPILWCEMSSDTWWSEGETAFERQEDAIVAALAWFREASEGLADYVASLDKRAQGLRSMIRDVRHTQAH